jgi:O-antigen ligase
VQPTTRAVGRGTVGLEGTSHDTYAGDPVSASGVPTPAEYCLFTSIGPKLMTRLLVEKTPSSTLPQKKIYILIRSRIIPKIVRWTFLLFVFTLPFETLDIEAIHGTSSARIVGLLCFSTCLFYSKLCFRRPPQALWWFAGYVFVYVLMSLLTPEKVAGQLIKELQTFIQLLILCWISFTFLQEEKFARHTLLTFSITILLLATGMLLGLPGISQIRDGRLSAMSANPNGLACYMGMAAQVLIGFGIDHTYRKRWRQVTFLVLSLLPLIAMVYTGSRGGILASMTGVAVYALPSCGSKRKMMAILGTAIVVISVIYLVLNDQSTMSRFERTYEQGEMAGRDIIFARAVEMISEKPLLGWGNVSRSELGVRTGDGLRGRDTHNLFLYLLTTTGLLGTIPFLIGLGLCMRAAWTARVCSLGLLPLAWLVTIMVISMSGTPIGDKLMWIALALSLASGASTVKHRMRKNLLTKTILQLSQKRTVVHTTGF